MNIEDLDLSVRSYNCLKRAGIDTVEQLRQMDDEQLSRVRNISVSCVQEIRAKVESGAKKKPTISVDGEKFGTVLNCAVRYAIGRQTYMPGLVIDFIMPLIPYLSDNALWCFDQDVTDAKWTSGYGDPKIDEPGWMKFHAAVREERTKRGHELYKSWREEA